MVNGGKCKPGRKFDQKFKRILSPLNGELLKPSPIIKAEWAEKLKFHWKTNIKLFVSL
jgi:hypothetical protein